MWHASAALLPQVATSHVNYTQYLELMAREALEEVGWAKLGEWVEVTPRAVHVRRRLAPAEETIVGEVKDLRGTPEARRRFEEMKNDLPKDAREIARREIGPPQAH